MELWVKLSIWIGTFGFFKEFRPEDPYIVQYLTGHKMNFTDEQVNQVIFPVSTYTSLVELVFVFLITDWLRYKPVVILCALSGVIVQVMLIWGRGITAMRIMEIFYGTYGSTEVAYYTYIYAKVEPQYFQQVTSYMRGAVLSGRFISSIVSQVLLIGNIMTIDQLNDLTLGGMVCAFFWAIGLPSVPRSLYFHRQVLPLSTNNGASAAPSSTPNDVHSNGDIASKSENVTSPSSSWSNAAGYLWDDFKFAFTNAYVLKWSAWVSLSTCGYTMLMAYVQILWKTVDENITQYNGAIEAVYTLTSASAAFLFGRVMLDWTIHGESLLGLLTLAGGILVTLSAFTSSMIFCYVVYVLFGTLYHIQMTVAYSEIAKHIKPDSYALVFGVNSFASLLFQTVMTFTVAGDQVFVLPIRTQFTVYGIFFLLLGSFYLIKAVVTYIRLYTCGVVLPKNPHS
ncbi:hypothetical protein M8J76_009711 [Diaphorina citri]|nr:hypothetical protein M8J75_014841 [Diaphorina citri]KAI5709862.1 hypothetical protein M8J75_003742 [Diaphorina citri]KAI5745278.1 hypothetical protein M8J76_009711 [Diaphorina citri]KAI5750946.1 hypothetical protein M8J77_002703 [Diaphorina citri]